MSEHGANLIPFILKQKIFHMLSQIKMPWVHTLSIKHISCCESKYSLNITCTSRIDEVDDILSLVWEFDERTLICVTWTISISRRYIGPCPLRNLLLGCDDMCWYILQKYKWKMKYKKKLRRVCVIIWKHEHIVCILFVARCATISFFVSRCYTIFSRNVITWEVKFNLLCYKPL